MTECKRIAILRHKRYRICYNATTCCGAGYVWLPTGVRGPLVYHRDVKGAVSHDGNSIAVVGASGDSRPF